MANLRLRSLRTGVAPEKAEPRDMWEALRDLYQAFKGLLEIQIKRADSVVWAVPYYISADHLPDAVVLVRCRVAKQPVTVDVGAVDWTYTGTQIRVDGIVGLTIGTSYDLVFQVIG